MKTILVLDDSLEMLELFDIILKDDYNTVTVNNKEAFYTALHTDLPDLILLDAHLGSDDGKELCGAIKTDIKTSHIPVLLLSVDALRLKDFKKYKADDALEKPFDLDLLFQKISSLIR